MMKKARRKKKKKKKKKARRNRKIKMDQQGLKIIHCFSYFQYSKNFTMMNK